MLRFGYRPLCQGREAGGLTIMFGLLARIKNHCSIDCKFPLAELGVLCVFARVIFFPIPDYCTFPLL